MVATPWADAAGQMESLNMLSITVLEHTERRPFQVEMYTHQPSPKNLLKYEPGWSWWPCRSPSETGKHDASILTLTLQY